MIGWLPATDRTPDGWLRWRVWVPFWLGGFGTAAALLGIDDSWPLLVQVAVVAACAVGVPAAAAARLTRRRPDRRT